MTEALTIPSLLSPAASVRASTVSRDASGPLYGQLREAIVSMIAAEGLVPGDLLPSEHQLCQEFGVSRTVVRQALAQLDNEGLVQRVKGKGTFVGHPKTSEHLMHTLLGLYEDVEQRGGEVRSDVLAHRTIPADREVATQLELDEGAPVVELRRMRYVDGEPWALSTAWLPEAYGRLTTRADLTEESLYRVLERHGIVGVTGWRSVEAVLADRDSAQLLGIHAGSALLKLESVRRDASGVPIDYFVAYHRGDRSRFEFELTNEHTLARVLTHSDQ